MDGKEKALALLSLLGDNSQEVLGLLSPNTAQLLTTAIGDSPDLDSKKMSQFALDTIDELKSLNPGLDIFQKQTLASSELESSAGFDQLESETEEKTDADAEAPEDVLVPDEKEAEESPSSFSFDDTPAPDTDKEEKSQRDATLRSAKKIASLLETQSPQTVAFLFSDLDEGLREDITKHLSDEFSQKIIDLKVETTPISKKIYDKLYQELCVKDEGEEDEPEDNDNLESQGDPFSFL